MMCKTVLLTEGSVCGRPASRCTRKRVLNGTERRGGTCDDGRSATRTRVAAKLSALCAHAVRARAIADRRGAREPTEPTVVAAQIIGYARNSTALSDHALAIIVYAVPGQHRQRFSFGLRSRVRFRAWCVPTFRYNNTRRSIGIQKTTTAPSVSGMEHRRRWNYDVCGSGSFCIGTVTS